MSAGTHVDKRDCTDSDDPYYCGWYFRARSRHSCFATKVEQQSVDNAFMEVASLYNPFKNDVSPTPAHGFSGGMGLRNKLNFDGSVFISTKIQVD